MIYTTYKRYLTKDGCLGMSQNDWAGVGVGILLKPMTVFASNKDSQSLTNMQNCMCNLQHGCNIFQAECHNQWH